jgi:tetratricopeptide (TPR) repeat protein
MIQLTLLVFLGWLLSLCLHEFGHAIVAYWGGDTSVKEKGYLTLNPLKYVDPVLSLVMPMMFLLIGGIGLPGAAVYIIPSNIRNRLWLSLTSLAGPLASMVATILLVGIYKVLVGQLPQDNFLELVQMEYASRSPTNQPPDIYALVAAKYWHILGLSLLIYLQVYGVILNLLPIPALDGFGVIEPWFPKAWERKLRPVKQYGFGILIALFWFSPAFSRQFTQWCSQITRFLDVNPDYIQVGFIAFQRASTPLVAVVFVVFVIVRKLTTKKHDALYESALAYRRNGKPEAALRDLEKAIAQQPDFPKAMLLKAEILYDRGDYAGAVSVWQPLLAEYANDLGIQQRFAHAQWNLGDLEPALALCDRLLSDFPNDSYVWQLKAGILNDLKREDEALLACDRGLALEPKSIYLWELKGGILWQKQCLEPALAAYQKITEINNRLISAWISQSKLLTKLNQLENALACSDRALEIDPHDLNSLSNYAYILCLLHRYDQALQCFDQILRKDAKNANAFYNKACCYAALEQLDLAITQLKSAILYGGDALKQQAKTDHSLLNLHSSQEFQQLVS